MAKLERTWPSDAFDAIGILAVGGQIEIKRSESNEVKLEAEIDRRAMPDLPLEPTGRWLQLYLWEHGGDAQFTLRLPSNKNWVVDVSAAHGQVSVNGISARLRVMLGRGEVQIEDCRGIFSLASGKGQVEIERCVEAEMPERPAVPEPQFQSADAPEPPPTPGGPGMAGEFHAHFGPGMHHRPRPNLSWDWMGFDADDWSEWGAQIGEQARVWAQQFAGHFVTAVDWLPEKASFGVRIGKGSAKLQEIETKSCSLRLGSGDVELKGGRIEELQVRVARGDIKCESVMPAGDWSIDVKNGNIQVALPSNTQARLDVATRHGDIDSQVPLVRVGRPGPESRFGGRMVGTVGQPGADLPALSLTTVRGDVEIRLEESKSRFAPKTSPSASSRAEPAQEAAPTAPPVATTAAANATEPARPSDATVEAGKPEPSSPGPAYDSQLAILQALSKGQITVEEAERLLQGLGH